MSHSARIRRAFVAALCIALGAGCDRMASSGEEVRVREAMARAERYAEQLAARPASTLSDGEVIALGYLERLRIGLGSPFRLMEFAMRDPDLPAPDRERLALAILGRTRDGRAYEVDPGVLEVARLAGVQRRQPTGGGQLELIERTVAAAPNPGTGERAVRLGYELAAAERTVRGAPESVVAHVAALVADRRRARADAAALMRAAERAGVSPLVLLPGMRRGLRFRVESPPTGPAAPVDDEAAARQGPTVALALRTQAQRLAASAGYPPSEGPPAGRSPRSLLSPEAAARLLAVAARRDHAPQAPVAVAVLIHRDAYLAGASIRAFADSAWNEERLVAGVSAQQGVPRAQELRLALVQLQAAVFMRSWNQEEPWFPGDPAPAQRDLVARFGLAAVEFGPEVPDRWRPYFLRSIGRGLSELQRVLPTASVRGLTIRVAELPARGSALALHDARRRVLYLPPRTGAGTLAHEIAHDLDARLARTRYGARAYATDLAVSRRRGDRIAYALEGLERSLTQPGGAPSAHDSRPAELFARGVDWFVASSLARIGRTGGYLTSYQDPLLTGHGTTRGPDVGGGAVSALFTLLDGVAPVGREERQWALDSYGPDRVLTAMELARILVHAPSGRDPLERIGVLAALRDRARASVDSPLCTLTSADGLRRLSAAQRALVQAATTATARGVAVDAARDHARQLGVSRRLADAWMQWRLYGAPEPADSAVRVLAPALEEILYRVRELEREDRTPLMVGGAAPRAVVLCAGNPFAAEATHRGP